MRTRALTIAGGKDALFAALADEPHAFFLESALPAGGLGKFSFLGCAPQAVFRVATGTAEIEWREDGRREPCAGDPLEALRIFHARCAEKFWSATARRRFEVRASARTDGEPRLASESGVEPPHSLPFAGGLVGFFSYEFGLRFERIARTSPDDLAVPEAEWAFYDGVFTCDETTGEIFTATCEDDPTKAEKILTRLEQTAVEKLSNQGPRNTPNTRNPKISDSDLRAFRVFRGPNSESVGITSNFTRAGYERAVSRVKDYIRSGDVYQINLSQRFTAPLPCAAAELYTRLRALSPAPYGCFLNFGDVQVAGVSPERFLRVEGDQVTTRPIKGTRPRGRDAAEDVRLRDELAASAKDRAELLMIVDLERNDLGRVCVPGSVHVENLYALEAHPTVWHQVADVSGRLAPGRDVFDCLRATFPGGSITGAPKIRAMKIIDELEPHRRHLYTGAVGYLGGDGRAELNIAIRTITCAGGRAYFHAGGGVVWDSDPSAEYEETLTKARALRAALAGESSPVSAPTPPLP